MAHEIDISNGKAAIAFVGQTPWHGLGQQLTPGQGIEIWRKEAGLDYDVLRSQVHYSDDNGATLRGFKDRDVLYRSDNGTPLSVVGKNYKVVQPGEILDFFAKLSEIGGFDLEVAGALSDGKRVWGLAKAGDGAPIIGQDEVRPYVLFATSYDGTMATVAKFTAIRVVCNNTITMAVGKGAEGLGKTETDTENMAVSSLVRIPHSQKVNADEIRLKLGIVSNVYEKWLVETRLMAEKAMNMDEADKFVFKLIDSITPTPAAGKPLPDVRKSKAYTRIMEMFDGDLIGADLAGGMNRWTMLNAVTEYVDHERGKTDDSRLSQAWFGAGDGLKNRAYGMLADA
jgi:phage/plasmid-like protein (TIGR03299 family)